MNSLLPKKDLHTSLGGLEPPTFRLTAERANQLRHRDLADGKSTVIDINCQLAVGRSNGRRPRVRHLQKVCSNAGNRTRAAWVKARNPNH